MYRLIFSDLDGTLFKFDFTISPAVVQALREVVDAGILLVACTGRAFQQTTPLLDQIPTNAPVICGNGGVIVDPRTRRVLMEQASPVALAHEAIRVTPKEGVDLRICFDDLETTLEYRPKESRYVLSRARVVVQEVNDPFASVVRPVHKIMLVPHSTADVPPLIAQLQVHFGSRANVLASSARWIEIIPPGVSKAAAMAWLAQYLGVPQAETLAMGDADNDVEMLEWAAFGIAMGNAMPAALAAADWVAPSVDDDGAAVALRRFVLAAQKPA